MAPLSTLCFCFTGTHSKPRAGLESDCAKEGILCNSGVRKRTTHLISTQNECDANTKKVQEAIKGGVPIVTEEYMDDCIAKKKAIDHTPYLLQSFTGVTAASVSSSAAGKKAKVSTGKSVAASHTAPKNTGTGPAEARLVMLAHKFEDKKVDPKGWWMSEKLDGVRAYWDGYGFYSRNGNPFPAPDWFVEDLPKKVPLDGELWVGRGQFSMALSIAKSASGDASRWKFVCYSVFDAPKLQDSNGKPMKYEERKDWLDKNLKSMKYADSVPSVKCTGQKHLDSELKKIESFGGEGLMIRQPASVYDHKRSRTLLKVKSFHDEEAIVTGHQAGHGKNTGLCGALLLETPDGRTLKAGTGLTDADRRKPPKIGAVVTYKYFEISASGSPRFPAFVGERIDIDWDDYCKNYTKPTIPGKNPKMKRTHSIMFGSNLGREDSGPTKKPAFALPNASSDMDTDVDVDDDDDDDDNRPTKRSRTTKKPVVSKAKKGKAKATKKNVADSEDDDTEFSASDDDDGGRGSGKASTRASTRSSTRKPAKANDDDDGDDPFEGAANGAQREFSGGHMVQIVDGDLLRAEAECIVNSTNTGMQHKNGLGLAMAKVAGPSLQKESDAYTKKNGDLSEGEVAITGSGGLPCQYVLHTVTPHFDKSDVAGSFQRLVRCIAEILKSADSLGITSMAIPVLGSGIAGYPLEWAARAIITAISMFFVENQDSPLFLVGVITNDKKTVPKLEMEVKLIPKSIKCN